MRFFLLLFFYFNCATLGITKRNPLEYIVGTLNGHLECLRLKITKATTISIESNELRPPNGHSKYALYGLTNSGNNAFLIAAYFARKVSVNRIISN